MSQAPQLRLLLHVPAVHSDATALIDASVLKRAVDVVEFPYESAHVDFILKSA